MELVPHRRQAPSGDAHGRLSGYTVARELGVLAAALLLFAVVLFSENWLHRQDLRYLELILTLTAYLLAGWNVIVGAFRTIRKGALFDENVLMAIATGGALAIHAYSEAVGVMIFYKVGEMLQELAVSRSRRSISGLLAAKPDRALFADNGRSP